MSELAWFPRPAPEPQDDDRCESCGHYWQDECACDCCGGQSGQPEARGGV